MDDESVILVGLAPEVKVTIRTLRTGPESAGVREAMIC